MKKLIVPVLFWRVMIPVIIVICLGIFLWGAFLGYQNINSSLFGNFHILITGTVIVLLLALVWGHQQAVAKEVHSEVAARTNDLEQASKRFKMITNNAYDLISIVTIDGCYDYVNSAYHRVLGYSHDDLLTEDIIQFIHPKDQEQFKKVLQEVQSGRNTVEVTFRMRHKKGSWIYLEAIAKGLYASDWSLSDIVIHSRDVTSRKMYADELSRSEQRFRDFAQSSSDWLWEIEPNLEFSYISPGVKQTLGFSPDDMIGTMKFDALFDDNNDTTRDLIESRILRHQPYRDIEFWTRSKNGERVCLRISGVPVFNEKQEFIGYRGAATNITASKIDRENMFRLATTDNLTGLLNRARFMEELERTLGLAKRHKTSGVLLFIDLDRFKEVNDTHGHDAGDALLKAISSILQRAVRSTDIVARLGGDEFGIIMHNIDVDRAKLKVDKIIEEINRLNIDYKGVTIQATMSIGMVLYPQEDRDSASLIMSADLAMYRAKDQGRNRMYIDDSGEDLGAKDSVREQLKWVERLREALEIGDFEMYFQPLVPRKKLKRPLFEALIRLRDEAGDLGAPGIFIDAAEHFGLIQKLDLSVVNRCFEQQLKLKEQGIDIDLTINLSGKTIGDVRLIEVLQEAIKKYPMLKPSNFIFEVTETSALHNPNAMSDLEAVRLFVAEIKLLGFRFALDDFGTGFSSFNYIKHLDVDIIKIDGSFIRHLATSRNDQLFVKAIVDLAKGLEIETVAEFVEDEKILKILDGLGIDYAQGYHIGRPDSNLEIQYDDFNHKRMADFF